MPSEWFSSRCPFHSFALGFACSLAAAVPACYFLFKGRRWNGRKRRELVRYNVDARFTDVCSWGPLVFMSGQVEEGETIEEQTRAVLASIDAALATAGSSKERILELTIWLADMADYDRMNAVYDLWIVPGTRHGFMSNI